MQIAIDNMNNRINIIDATKGESYFCPVCEESLIQRKGNVNAWHFSHKRATTCDNWYKDNEWCVNWQSMFHENYREVVIKDENESHRADIKINNLIIKFQDSTITGKDFDRRHNFFTQHGNLVWVINLQDKDIEERTYKHTRTTQYIWKHAYKLNNLEAYGNNFNLFFQVEDDVLVKVVWNKQGYKYFGGNKFTKNMFMRYLNSKIIKNVNFD